MSELKNWITRSSIISIAAGAEFASRFGRTAILSRLLSPSEFGTSVAITVVISTAGLITDVAFDKFVIIRPDEDRVLAAAHMLSIIRGGLVALTMVLCASSVAAFFGVSQSSASFAVIAASPFVRSFSHLGIAQVQREHNYVPATLTLLVAQVIALAAVLPAVYFWRDHRAIVISLIVEALAYCIASHMLAPRPYRLQSDREVFSAALAFGVPLLVNGIGLAVFSQLDRFLVGHWFDVTTLATYAIVLNMVVVPIALVNRVFGTLGLAHISSRMKNQSVVPDDYLSLVFLWGVLGCCLRAFLGDHSGRTYSTYLRSLLRGRSDCPHACYCHGILPVGEGSAYNLARREWQNGKVIISHIIRRSRYTSRFCTYSMVAKIRDCFSVCSSWGYFVIWAVLCNYNPMARLVMDYRFGRHGGRSWYIGGDRCNL